MTNFKNKILKSLDNEKQLEKTLEEMSKFQQNLLKNQSNPVFNKKDKNTILKSYSDLENLGKSLYRYDTLKQYNLLKDIQAEKENISNTVLKGGISNSRYIWRSEHGENTCEKCLSLDGQEFEFYDEVPERPHPNCRCHVEIVEDDNTNPKPKKEDEEACDCYKFIEQIDELLNKIDSLREIVAIRSKYFAEQLPYNISLKLEQAWQYILEQYTQLDNALGDLARNFVESRENIFENSDKYYHTKGHCQVAQREESISREIAEGAGYFREFGQFLANIITQEHSIIEAYKDGMADIKANKTGIELGKNFPNDDCEVILKTVWPHDLKKNE